MSKKLFADAITKILAGIIILGLLIFLPAGTFFYSAGWILMTVLFVPMIIAGIIMMLKCPDVLARRLDAKEQQKEQGAVINISAFMFVSGFITAGLDFRFGWSRLPEAITVIAVIIFIISYILYGEVIRENRYLSRTIKVEEGQRVADKGLYAIIRHPMYLSTIFLFLSMPLILGSIYSFFIFLTYPIVIIKRIKYEEKLLFKELSGYSEYMEKVKYRLIPFIW